MCLLVWGTIVELELNLPESRDKIQWIAIALWSIETFPQITLNIKRQSTSGQATTSVLIALVGKTTDFLVTYGLLMPLPYVVMCYFSSSSAFINTFQVCRYLCENLQFGFVSSDIIYPKYFVKIDRITELSED